MSTPEKNKNIKKKEKRKMSNNWFYITPSSDTRFNPSDNFLLRQQIEYYKSKTEDRPVVEKFNDAPKVTKVDVPKVNLVKFDAPKVTKVDAPKVNTSKIDIPKPKIIERKETKIAGAKNYPPPKIGEVKTIISKDVIKQPIDKKPMDIIRKPIDVTSYNVPKTTERSVTIDVSRSKKEDKKDKKMKQIIKILKRQDWNKILSEIEL